MGEGKKPKLGDMRACARGIFVAFPDLASCGSEGAGRGWGRWAESSPISWKSAQGLSRVLLLFSVGTTSCERAQGRLGDCAALFLRWARRAFQSLPERLRSSGGEWFVAEQWEAEVGVFFVRG